MQSAFCPTLDAVFNFCVLLKWICAEALQQSVKLTGQQLWRMLNNSSLASSHSTVLSFLSNANMWQFVDFKYDEEFNVSVQSLNEQDEQKLNKHTCHI